MNVSKIQLLAEAVRDMETGKSFYDKQQQGVGEYFWDSLLADIESLLIHAGVHTRVFGYHRMLSRRFPYAIYYEVSEEIARVIAILPARRNPAWLAEQFTKRN